MWGEGEVRTRRQPGRPDVFLAISSCFCPLIFLPFSPDTLVPRIGVGMGEGEGQGSKPPQRETCLSMAYARIGRGSSPLGQATSPPRSPTTSASRNPSWELGQSPILLLLRVCQWSTQMILNSKIALTPTLWPSLHVSFPSLDQKFPGGMKILTTIQHPSQLFLFSPSLRARALLD